MTSTFGHMSIGQHYNCLLAVIALPFLTMHGRHPIDFRLFVQP